MLDLLSVIHSFYLLYLARVKEVGGETRSTLRRPSPELPSPSTVRLSHLVDEKLIPITGVLCWLRRGWSRGYDTTEGNLVRVRPATKRKQWVLLGAFPYESEG